MRPTTQSTISYAYNPSLLEAQPWANFKLSGKAGLFRPFSRPFSARNYPATERREAATRQNGNARQASGQIVMRAPRK
jgi:hypothetical protein